MDPSLTNMRGMSARRERGGLMSPHCWIPSAWCRRSSGPLEDSFRRMEKVFNMLKFAFFLFFLKLPLQAGTREHPSDGGAQVVREGTAQQVAKWETHQGDQQCPPSAQEICHHTEHDLSHQESPGVQRVPQGLLHVISTDEIILGHHCALHFKRLIHKLGSTLALNYLTFVEVAGRVLLGHRAVVLAVVGSVRVVLREGLKKNVKFSTFQVWKKIIFFWLENHYWGTFSKKKMFSPFFFPPFPLLFCFWLRDHYWATFSKKKCFPPFFWTPSEELRSRLGKMSEGGWPGTAQLGGQETV